MAEGAVYDFEDVPPDLPRAPLAAMRVMLLTGMFLSPRGWEGLDVWKRRALTEEGARDAVDEKRVVDLMRGMSLGQMSLVPKVPDPDPNARPEAIVRALGPGSGLDDDTWRRLRALDRRVLFTLVTNGRLFQRALTELGRSHRKLLAPPASTWVNVVGRAEINVRPEAVQALTFGKVEGGRAFVLARVAGVRAARAMSTVYDRLVETMTGPVELDSAIDRERNVIVWQSHVTAADGSFFPAATLAAASTAAIAIFDMIQTIDRSASFLQVGLVEQRWEVGSGDYEESATTNYKPSHLR